MKEVWQKAKPAVGEGLASFAESAGDVGAGEIRERDGTGRYVVAALVAVLAAALGETIRRETRHGK